MRKPRTTGGCEDAGMREPRFKIFDIVQIGDHPRLAAAGLSGQRGAITQIREYPGPQFRYRVRSLANDDDEVGGLYDEENLLPTGEQVSRDLFGLPGGFRIGDIVQLSSTYEDPQIAGRTGVIDGTYTDEGGIGARIEELGESVIVQPLVLTPTGERLPMPGAGRAASSTQVSIDGQVKGQTTYIIVDEVDRYL
jgi:hypothetical protein